MEINKDQHQKFWQTVRGKGRKSRGAYHNKTSKPYGLKEEVKKPKQLRPLTKFNLENMTDIAQIKPRKVITTETQDSASEDSLASQGDFADFFYQQMTKGQLQGGLTLIVIRRTPPQHKKTFSFVHKSQWIQAAM